MKNLICYFPLIPRNCGKDKVAYLEMHKKSGISKRKYHARHDFLSHQIITLFKYQLPRSEDNELITFTSVLQTLDLFY